MIFLAGNKLRPREREAFVELCGWLRSSQRRLEGSGAGDSSYDRLELQPGYSELLGHVDRAVRWADELERIIREELS